MSEHRGNIEVIYISYPLDYHPHALAAARGAECAAAVGALPSWIRAVFAKQDSLGTKSWASYAVDAEIRDPDAIQRCATDTTAVPAIDLDLAFGQSVHLDQTPTIILDGWRFRGTPTAAQLDFATDLPLRWRSLKNF